jgi:ribosomal protein L11 methyltransferase
MRLQYLLNLPLNILIYRQYNIVAIFCRDFDIIIANINRNILLADMERYAAVLNAGGTLLLSGFYEADEAALLSHAKELGMSLASKKNRNGWSALELTLNS